jgi:hypothetical protein
MAEFLETIERIRSEEADVRRIYTREDGQSVRTLRRDDPRYKARLAEAAKLIANVYTGRVRPHVLQEAMGTDDFPILFGDVLDRQVLATYRETPYSWNKIVRRRLVRDFREVKRITLDGGDGVLKEVKQQAPYPAASLAEGEYKYAVTKFGRRMPFTWEDMINDDLDTLSDIPKRLGIAARRTEEKFVTELFMDAAGWNSTFFSGGNANLISGNPLLGVEGLMAGMQLIAANSVKDGEPIAIDGFTLWTGPGLDIPASNILNALQLELTGGGGSTAAKLIASNWVKARITHAVGPYFPLVNTTSGNTAWALFANPEGERPAGEVGFLRGHEEPEVFMKAPNAIKVGSGSQDPTNGDFDTDSVEYKVRHVLGGARMDPKMAVASTGAGS